MGFVDFIENDVPRTLFPLVSPAAFVGYGEADLRAFVNSNVFDAEQPDGFLKAAVGFAMKDPLHTRRVLVLDAISLFFLYDIVWRHRESFQVPRAKSLRRFFGPGFDKKGSRIDTFRDYHSFRGCRYDWKKLTPYQARADVFNCFNSFYHHRVARDVGDRTTREEGERFGQFLREVNAGDSIWCFPQGYYPAKAIGNHYLRFVENSRDLQAKRIVRFLDDIYLFGNRKADLTGDLLRLQEVLARHYLSLNDLKTWIGSSNESYGQEKIDEIRKQLLIKRQSHLGMYDEEDDEDDDTLSEAESEYLLDLLKQKDAPAEDIELGLSLLSDSAQALMLLVPHVLKHAPHLLRQLHRACQGDGFTDEVAQLMYDGMLRRLASPSARASHELFWYAKLMIDYYRFDQTTADALLEIAGARTADRVVKSAILETPYLKHGLLEFKEKELDAGHLDLTTGATMYGLRAMDRASRNQKLKYIGRAGAQWRLITKIASHFRSDP